jgi:hypothetical protein
MSITEERTNERSIVGEFRGAIVTAGETSDAGV